MSDEAPIPDPDRLERVGCLGVILGLNLSLAAVALTPIAWLVGGGLVPLQAGVALAGALAAVLFHVLTPIAELRLWQRGFLLVDGVCLVLGLPGLLAWWQG